jgi:hypothetical protein
MNKQGSTVRISMQSASKANKYGSSYAEKEKAKQNDSNGIHNCNI